MKMRIAYLDIFCGISGDMLLAALIDAGADPSAMREALASLAPGRWDLQAEGTVRSGISATAVHVVPAGEEAHAHEQHAAHHGHHHRPSRSYRELSAILDASSLPHDLRDRVAEMLRSLAEVEAAIHGVAVEDVHFHEVGGLDTLIDLTGALVGLDLLGVERVVASPVPLAHGFVDTAHGRLPVPAPATAALLEGLPTRPLDVEGETVTPTGAALVRYLADSFGPPPPMTIRSIAHGAGSKDFGPVPNVLRLLIGEVAEPAVAAEGLLTDTVVELSANVDDMSPELYEPALDAIFAAGAVDAWLTPIVMKRQRPAVQISALTPSEAASAVAEAMLLHTTSLGVRMTDRRRLMLPREMTSVETPYGAVAVKVARLRGRIVTAQPEYRDCADVARREGATVREVYEAALGAARSLE